MSLKERSCFSGHERGNAIEVELEANDRRAAEKVALAGSQAIESHRQQPCE
jgi:hypothetical protein